MEIEPEVTQCMKCIVNKIVHRENVRKNYYKNKDKILQQQKEYQEKTKQKRSQQQKEYRMKNKDKILQHSKDYYQKHKDKISEYNKTPDRVKARRIKDWKYQGVICDDWDAIYEHFINTAYCDFCKCELTTGTVMSYTTKCLDHDHSITDRPNFRNVLCNICNIRRK